MNKKFISFLSSAAVIAAGLTGCSEEQTLAVGEGTMYVSTRVSSDVKVVSRASTEEELAESTIVWIYSDQGVVRKYNGMAEIPASGIKLISGDYTVKAWAGKAEYASFESRWFEGSESVTIEPNNPVAVEVVCKIANVVASVKYPENVDDLISDYSLTVSHKGGSLTFEGRDDRKGYYMMPEGVTALDYELTFTAEGEVKTVTGTINDVEPAHEYVFNVVATEENAGQMGGAFITIEVDDTTVDVEDTITITVAPEISGYGFDLSAPVAGESGGVGRKSVYVCGSTALRSIRLSGIPAIEGYEEVDMIRASNEVLADLAQKGISREITDVEGGAQMVKIIFDDVYLNSLPNSDEAYVISINATDNEGKSSSAALTLRISEAPVVTAPVDESATSYAKATLVGTVAKDGLEAVGFEYAPVGTEDWQYVAGATSRSFTKGQTYYATVSGLQPGVTYRYRAVTGTADAIDFRGDEVEFATLNGPQLPNAGMEEWSTGGSNNATMPMPAGASGWDSGNHGAKLASKVLTEKVSSPKHSGAASARLSTMMASVLGMGKLAAGNLFFGEYIKTDGMDGIIGFGRPFDFPKSEIRLKALRLWVKYTPAAVTSSKGHLSQGASDEGHIFIALFDGPDNGDKESKYNGKYGRVVRTKSSDQRLFDRNASNVIAYGEHIFTSATSGSGLVMLEIPVEYYPGKESTLPTIMSIVCTASRYGDYYEGGEGSQMIVDDFELVYEAI